MSDGQAHTVNSEHKWTCFITDARALYDEFKYVTWPKPRIGPDRSIDQNALFYVWLTEYAAHLLKKTTEQVTAGEVEGMKRCIKGHFYQEFSYPWMVHKVLNPETGQTKKDYTSSAKWKRGEIYLVLDYMQMKAAGDRLVLESKGQYAKLKREASS